MKHDVRRVWECPICGRREHTGGQVVNRLCPCHPDTDPPRLFWMRLVEDGRKAPEAPAAPEALTTERPRDGTP